MATQRNLSELKERLHHGYARSVQRKEELRLHAADTLHNLSTVLDKHEKLQEEEENERLRDYV